MILAGQEKGARSTVRNASRRLACNLGGPALRAVVLGPPWAAGARASVSVSGLSRPLARSVAPQRRSSSGTRRGRAVDWALAARRREQGTAPGRGWPAAPRCRGPAAVCARLPGHGGRASAEGLGGDTPSRVWSCRVGRRAAWQVLGVAACFFGVLGVGVGGAPACVTVAIGPRVVADDPRRTGKVGPFYGAQCFTKARVQPWWARTLSRCARAALGRGRRAAVCVRGIGEQLARSVAPQRRSSNALGRCWAWPRFFCGCLGWALGERVRA